jgi:hypothetical protein
MARTAVLGHHVDLVRAPEQLRDALDAPGRLSLGGDDRPVVLAPARALRGGAGVA